MRNPRTRRLQQLDMLHLVDEKPRDGERNTPSYSLVSKVAGAGAEPRHAKAEAGNALTPKTKRAAELVVAGNNLSLSQAVAVH